MATTQETVLSVPDISCEHCVKTINTALGALQGVQSVETDISSKTVHLCYDPSQIALETVEATLDEAGYALAK
jgi:copper chaperone